MKRHKKEEIQAMDRLDPLAQKRSEFDIPPNLIYLDGNSLGALPKSVPAKMGDMISNQWGRSLIRGWNKHDWIDLPARVGHKIARLIGADSHTVIATDSTSINLFKVLAAALSLRPDRKVILSDTGNFPTDLYMAQGLIDLLGREHRLKIVTPEAVESSISEAVAVIMLTEVDYKTGYKHPMARLTQRAHDAGTLALWDLAHSAGAFPVDLKGCQVDFAVGCGYKYLNGGPGAPAFLYVAPEHQDRIAPALSGWMGHSAPFSFDLDYRPVGGVDRLRVGTPSVLSHCALDNALDVFADVDLKVLQKKSIRLCELFITEVEARCHGLKLASPREAGNRGSHVSFRCNYGYPLMQALIAHGVIGDFRAPDIVRFGFAPLYISHGDVWRAAEILEQIIKTRTWDRSEFKKKAKVT